MASLKDMRVRIASTKATQKITKAMQMVAASKLRRAQAAAEAARPYAESMERVLGNIASTVTDISAAPRLLGGTGGDQVHLLVVCTAERGLCGAFNSSIVRLARERINALVGQGKTVKIAVLDQRLAELDEIADDRVADVIGRQRASYVVGGAELTPGQLLERLGFRSAQLSTPVRNLSGG